MKEFLTEIQNKIQLVETAIGPRLRGSLLDSDCFKQHELSDDAYLSLTLQAQGRNVLPLTLILSISSLEIVVDYVHEVFEWSNQELLENRGHIQDLIGRLFSSYILIEDHGVHKMMFLFDSQGRPTNEFNLSTSVMAPVDKILIRSGTKHLYEPVYC